MMALGLGDRFAFLRQAASFLLSGKVEPNTILGTMLGNLTNPPRRRGGDFLKAYSESPWLRAVVHKVAYKCASVPSGIYKGPESKPTKLDLPDHPLMQMVNKGIPGVLTGLSIRMLTHIYLDLLGEAFWILDGYNVAGVPTAALPVPPTWVTDTPKADRPYYNLQLPGGGDIQYPPERVLWFKEPDPLNPYLRGVGAATSLSDEISTDEHAAKFVNRFFYNNARPGLIVSADGLHPDSLRRVEEDWNRRTAGTWNAFKTYFLNRKVDIQVLAQNFEHLQLMELRRWERDIVVQVYGVPPEELGIIENSNRATIEAADYKMASGVVLPRLALFDATIQYALAPVYDERLIYKHDDPVPANKEHEAKIALDVNSGVIMDVDERRAALGKDALTGGKGKVFMVPLNYVAVKSPADATLEPAPADEPDDNLPPDAPQNRRPGSAPVAAAPAAPVTKTPSEQASGVLFDLENTTRRFMGKVRPVYRMTMRDVGTQALKSLGIADPFNLGSKTVLNFINKRAASKIEDVLKTTRESLRSTIVEGLQEKDNIAQLASRVGEVFEDAKGYRATAIARTETGRAANFANVEAYEQSGVVEEKVWLATPDEKTRPSHLEANGQSVPLDEKFEVGDTELDYPLDPSADAEEVINCRCTTIAALRGHGREEVPASELNTIPLPADYPDYYAPGAMDLLPLKPEVKFQLQAEMSKILEAARVAVEQGYHSNEVVLKKFSDGVRKKIWPHLQVLMRQGAGETFMEAKWTRTRFGPYPGVSRIDATASYKDGTITFHKRLDDIVDALTKGKLVTAEEGYHFGVLAHEMGHALMDWPLKGTTFYRDYPALVEALNSMLGQRIALMMADLMAVEMTVTAMSGMVTTSAYYHAVNQVRSVLRAVGIKAYDERNLIRALGHSYFVQKGDIGGLGIESMYNALKSRMTKDPGLAKFKQAIMDVSSFSEVEASELKRIIEEMLK